MLISILPRAEQAILMVIWLATIIKANNPNFIYSVFPWKHPALLAVFVFFEVIIMFNVYVLTNFVFLNAFYYVFSSNFWLKRIMELR
jgi:hypothetical protein